jgi:hypothetical protein
MPAPFSTPTGRKLIPENPKKTAKTQVLVHTRARRESRLGRTETEHDLATRRMPDADLKSLDNEIQLVTET